MLHNQKIIFISIVDNNSKMVPNLGTRIWHHEVLIRDILERKPVLMGRKTFELSRWKGNNTWVITKNKKFSRSGIGVIHDLDDIHLHTEGPLFVLGGSSLFRALEEYVDEIHMYVLNNTDGKEKWINMDMHDWLPKNFKNENIWSYAHLSRKKTITNNYNIANEKKIRNG
jgi:dihydrofolate reductase